MSNFDEHFGDESYCDDTPLIEMTAESAPVIVCRKVRHRRTRTVKVTKQRNRFAPDRQFFMPIALTRKG